MMFAFREELLCLPKPPNLYNLITSIYSKHKLPLPHDLYAPLITPPHPDIDSVYFQKLSDKKSNAQNYSFTNTDSMSGVSVERGNSESGLDPITSGCS